ncbi:CIC11C00000003630 [Sungouiella intermedia]|uniref:CIC11C00000003630 n=1 Tax=Sungouiella intermedia TaxID=45354 RepID=A0A1L0BPK1_9ASCO|nr:CIC11C00000003630 [[Candida] intermedia]
MAQFQQQLEGVPGYDMGMDLFNEYAEKHFNNTDPFEDSEGNKRKLTTGYNSEHEKRAWKRVQSLAWEHDKCFLGSCGVGLDCGIGLVPIMVFLFPGVGPLAMYVVHSRLIHKAEENVHLPSTLVAKMQSNILLDLLLSLPPVIGAYLSWMHGCLTRNAGMFYVYLEYLAKERQSGRLPQYEGTRLEMHNMYAGTAREQNYARNQPNNSIQSSKQKKSKKLSKYQPMESIEVGVQQSGIR